MILIKKTIFCQKNKQNADRNCRKISNFSQSYHFRYFRQNSSIKSISRYQMNRLWVHGWLKILFLGRPETVVKCISMIYDILDKVPPKGSEQRYDPNCFDQTYDYGGTILHPRIWSEFRSFLTRKLLKFYFMSIDRLNSEKFQKFHLQD